jgi:nitrile hydratase subunit beta
MNSTHDMGGMHGFGRVEPEPDEPVFHAPWEGRVMAMQRAMGFARLWSIDGGRATIEALPPRQYLTASYYAKWLMGLERNVERAGLVGADEIAAGRSLRPASFATRVMRAADVAAMKRGDYARPAPKPARFAAGDRVRTANLNPATHTRLPRYARDKIGTVEAVRGCHVYPDTAAIGAGEQPQWLYTVAFGGRDLWGDATDPTLTVSIEAFEPYLLPA